MDSIKAMKKIIDEEVEAVQLVQQHLEINRLEYQEVIDRILHIEGHLILMGVGKSGHIGKKLAATFASTGTPAFFVHVTEAMHGDLGMITKNDVVMLISNSGETKEVIAPIDPIHRIGAEIIAVTGNNQSTLAIKSDYLLDVYVEKEADAYNLAPTSSSTATLVIGDSLALTVSEMKGFTEREFGLYHPGGALGQRLVSEGII